MSTLFVTDANTGNLVEIDTENPTGTLSIVDADTGEIIPVDLETFSGILHVVDANTGDIVTLDYSSDLSGTLHIVDENTGEIVEIDLEAPSGLVYTSDSNTGELVQLDLSVDKFIKSGSLVMISGTSDTTAPSVTGFTATTPNFGGTIEITTFTASESGVSYLITVSSTPPLAGAIGWSESVPTTFNATSEGSCTLYPWVKDTEGNVSTVYNSPVAVEVYETPSYANAGGTGDRQATITASTNATFGGGGTAAAMLNGVFVETIWFISAGQDVSGKYVQFQFTTKKVINEAKAYFNNTNSQGTWKWQGSNNGTSWTDIGSSFTLGGIATQTQTQLSGNITGYTYYRLLGVSGTTSAQYFREFEFKIGSFLA